MQFNFISCRMMFFIVAFYTGLWTVRIPTIKDQINSDYLGIGYLFISFSIGSIFIMIIINKIIKKYSSKKMLQLAGFGQAIGWLLLPFIKDFSLFLVLAFLFGIIYGVWEVSMNLQASNIEKIQKRPMMSGFHAYYSLGLLSGSFVTSLFIQIELNFILNTILVVGIMFPLTIIFTKFLEEDIINKDKSNKQNIFFKWPLLLIILVIITITDTSTEGAVDAWGALYMRDVIFTSGFKIGTATICFNLFMVLGRLIGDNIRKKIGTYIFLNILFLLSFIGISIIFTFSNFASSVIGFSILGLGMSCIVPLSYSIASSLKNIDNAVGISIVSISAYGVFMVVPALMGFIANFYGVNFVFAPMLIMFILCMLLINIFQKEFYLRS